MQQSSTVKKLLSACGLIAALFAVTTPFWLFSSEQSVTVVQKSKQQPSDGTTGTITLDGDNNSPTDSKDTATASTKATADKQSSSKANTVTNASDKARKDANQSSQQAKSAKPDSKATTDSKAAKATDSKSKDELTSKQDTAKDKSDSKASSDDKSAKATKSTDEKSSKSSDATKLNKDAKDSTAAKDVTLGADPKGSESKDTTASKGTDSKDAASSKDADKNNSIKDSNKDKAASDKSSDVTKEAKAIADAAKSATGEDKYATAAVESNELEESTVKGGEPLKQANLSLAEKVRNLTEQRTDADKAAYARSMEEREQQVDDAIASISGNYKVYLPGLLSEKAVVIYFSAPVTAKSTKINLRKDADLSKLKIDALTGATMVKYQDQDTFMDVEKPAMDYIAQTLSTESGAKLFKIATVTTYPDSAAKLYSMSFTELNEHKYPELTDDVPLDIDDYSVVYLCYPNWWGNMPGAIYSFLSKYDLSDKIIIPVCLYDRDEFSNTTDTIATIEPNATVYNKGMLINEKDCSNEAKLRNKIRTYLTNLSADFE